MNLVTLSGYVRRKNKVKKTSKGGDCLTFVLEVTTDKVKDKFLCVVYGRLIGRINKAVSLDDKVLVHGYLRNDKRKDKDIIVIDELELLDFIRSEDKVRDDRKRTKQDVIQERLARMGR